MWDSCDSIYALDQSGGEGLQQNLTWIFRRQGYFPFA
jgi:hypothetical protein